MSIDSTYLKIRNYKVLSGYVATVKGAAIRFASGAIGVRKSYATELLTVQNKTYKIINRSLNYIINLRTASIIASP